jgi:sugar lactone lactonase YvrE
LKACRPGVLLLILASLLWIGAFPIQGVAASWLASPSPFPPATQKALRQGELLPRIVCPAGYQASVYASGLRSPDGLAFGPDGGLYVAEETAGRVSRIDPNGEITLVVDGLLQPEGVDVDPQGNLYVTEDVQDGRILRIEPGGRQTVLAANRAAPEGVVWSPDRHLYITESNVHFSASPPWDFVTGITRISPEGQVTTVLTNTLLWSYSAITLDATGQLYVANEASSVGTTDSIFRVDPSTGTRTLFASDLVFPEGLAFSPGGRFPLYVTEEDVGDGRGRLSLVRSDGTHTPLCTGFGLIEDVAVDSLGNLYVSEDVNGLVVKITTPDIVPPGPPQGLAADPPGWTATNSFSLSWQNLPDPSGIAGAYLKLGAPPEGSADGLFYAGEELAAIAGLSVTGAGRHPAYLWLQDGAGNADAHNYATVTFHYDPDPPGSPDKLAVSPDTWTSVNHFDLSWTNPPELSGVMTACYQLDLPPSVAVEHPACQSREGITALEGLHVGDHGEHPAYVWLIDALGNADPASAGSVALRYDALPPESVAQAPPLAQVAPIRVTWVATDTHSGVASVSLWFKSGEDGSWADSGLSSPAEGPPFFLFQPMGEGLYAFATVATDRAGNEEAEPTGDGDAQTLCKTWQRAYLPLVWKASP